MANTLSACTVAELPEVLAALDAEFVTTRGRALSLAVRYPHLFAADQLAHLYLWRKRNSLLACAIARPFTWVTAERSWRCAMLGMVYTAPTARGQGHASRLLAAVLELLRESEIDAAVLWSGMTGFYEQRGWQRADDGRFGSLALTAQAPAAGEPTVPRSPLLTAPLIATAEKIRRSNSVPPIARSPLAWQCLPLPVERVWIELSGDAYALCGQAGSHTYLYEMHGQPANFSALWQHCCRYGSHIHINSPAESPSYRWLVQHTEVTWQPQRLTFWQLFSPPSQRLSFNPWHIPYFDRI